MKVKKQSRPKTQKELRDATRERSLEYHRLNKGKRFCKGFTPNPWGRMKGSKNKFTTLKNAFIEAFQDLGGKEWLRRYGGRNDWNAKIFIQAISRMLPREISVTDDTPVRPGRLQGLSDDELDLIIRRAEELKGEGTSAPKAQGVTRPKKN